MPDKIGKYTIKSELGRGAMGVVYWAEDPRLGRSVALKMMSTTVASDPELLQRFYREAQSAGQLRHPNIVTIYDIDEADGLPFIAMEFLEGESLEKIIKAHQDIPVTKKLDVLIQVCKGLHYAHQHGIVHRDVKPANIMVLEDGTAKIVDFGVARISSASMTSAGSVMGTPMYMSPEQVMGQTVDARSDIFSLGTVLYEVLTYENPFRGADITVILNKILNEVPAPLATYLPNCPPELEQIAARALAKNREERYQAAEDLAFALQDIASYLKRHMVEVYIQQGQRGLDEGNLTVAKESLQRVLEIDSSHNLAKSLLSKVQEQIHSRQRSQRIEQSMRGAKESLQAEQFDEAISMLDEILRVDPAHAGAQKYKDHAIDLRDRQKKIARHMQQAEKFLDNADLNAAKKELDSVLTFDSDNQPAMLLLQSVTKELADQERQRRVRQLTESARACLDERNYTKALGLIEQAAELDPINLDTEALFRQVKSAQETEEKQKRLNERLAQIQESLNHDQVEQALELAAKSLEEFPDESRVRKLHTQAARLVEMQKRERFIEEQLQTARGLSQKNQFSQAIALLENALQTVPDDARLAAFIKTVEDAQKQATFERMRQEAVQKANDQLRKNNFAGAIDTLEQALERVGRSRDLVDLLQFAREQQREQVRQERVSQVLGRAQPFLRVEDYEEAIRILEAGRREVQGAEIDSLLATAQEHRMKFEQRREEALQRALKLAEAGEPNKAVALLDASPKAYFKDENFQKVYAQCREGVARAQAIRAAIEQVDKLLAADNFIQAETAVKSALRDYPDDRGLLAAQKRIAEEQAQARSAALSKTLDEAKVSIGRMQYQEALNHLVSVDWKTSGFPDLAKKADALSEEANRKLEEARQKEERAKLEEAKRKLEEARQKEERAKLEEAKRKQEEARQKEERAKREAAARAALSPPPPDAPSLLSSQDRLREAMKAGPSPAKPGHGKPQHVEPSEGTADIPTNGLSTLPMVSPRLRQEVGKPEVAARAEVANEPTPTVAFAPSSVLQSLTPPAQTPVAPSKPAPPPPAPPTPRPARAIEPVPTKAAKMPAAVAAQTPAKGSPIALWAGVGLLLLVLAGIGIWRFSSGGGRPAPGYIALTAAPQARIVSIQTAGGKTIDKTGETPLLLELPAGDYVIELKNGTEVQKVNLNVQTGNTTKQNCVFSKDKINEMVDDLITHY
jgi:serine/threonine protein kinase